ncbi:hypothetical protein EPN28_01720 [Patescibacteria group bacterium]|nr:MAG: hypothetical protein EPN28_01720 [Patescibacteria group bacterium]
MYLKRLEIKGFKSFADKAVFEFMAPTGATFGEPARNNVTAIVGPNGAGKSNVSDALRWVMGEQSLKNLRGKKNEDIIFGGSEAKGQLSAAEVTMVLDNSDGKVLSEYPEIAITRRMFRSGEGEYLINNRPARLLDVHLLLAKAQFAQHSYSIIGQGMIDRLLTVGPAERKDFLDEASGIKEFQIKQHQAELKLARTRENIEQAGRLMQEVEPRLKILSRQVKKLEKRQEVERSLREWQERYYSSAYLANKKELDRLAASLVGVESEYRRAFGELETAQTELASLAHTKSRQEVFGELQSGYEMVLKEKNDLERQRAIKEGQMQAQYNLAGKQNVGWLRNKLAELKLKKDFLTKDLAAIRGESAAALRALLQKQKQLDALAQERADTQMEVTRLEKQALDDQSEKHYRQFTGLLAVQAVLENKNKFGKVYGLISELGGAEEKYRPALEVAAGSYLSAIVVEDEETARQAIEFLRANRLGVATFLPLTKISGREAPPDDKILREAGVLGLASELVRYEAKFAEIFSFVFGQTIIVNDLATANHVGVGRARMATLDGDLVEKSGVMKGGWRQQKRAGLGFSRKFYMGPDRFAEYQLEIKMAKEKMVELETRLESERAEALKSQTKKDAADGRAALLAAETNAAEAEIAGLEQELALQEADPKEYGEIVSGLSLEKSALDKQISAKQDEIDKLAEKISKFNASEEEKKQRVFSLQEEMQKKQNTLNGILTTRNDLKIEQAKLDTRQDAIVAEARAEMNASVEALIERRPPEIEPEKMGEALAEIQKLKYQLSLIGGIDEEVVKEHADTKEKFDFLDGQITDLRAAIEDLEKMIEELDDIMKKKRAAAFKKIRKEFERYVKLLFGGGSADMKEVYGEEENNADVVEVGQVESDPTLSFPRNLSLAPNREQESSVKKVLTGIDITINPPGKKIRNINALSGGERTLASIALICAVLNFNPAPFVVLDEVEAALDETNTRRFAQIMAELSSQSQFIIITHNRVTMHAADALYGVVMGSDGVSKLLSVKMEEAEQYDTPPAPSP